MCLAKGEKVRFVPLPLAKLANILQPSNTYPRLTLHFVLESSQPFSNPLFNFAPDSWLYTPLIWQNCFKIKILSSYLLSMSECLAFYVFGPHDSAPICFHSDFCRQKSNPFIRPPQIQKQKNPRNPRLPRPSGRISVCPSIL